MLWKEFPEEIFGKAEPYPVALKDFSQFKLHMYVYHDKSELVCVTHQVPTTEDITRKWLKKYNFDFEKIIVTADKHKVDEIDFLIDDSPLNYRKWVEEGKTPTDL